jgi:hypothetical protein
MSTRSHFTKAKLYSQRAQQATSRCTSRQSTSIYIALDLEKSQLTEMNCRTLSAEMQDVYRPKRDTGKRCRRRRYESRGVTGGTRSISSLHWSPASVLCSLLFFSKSVRSTLSTRARTILSTIYAYPYSSHPLMNEPNDRSKRIGVPEQAKQ